MAMAMAVAMVPPHVVGVVAAPVPGGGFPSPCPSTSISSASTLHPLTLPRTYYYYSGGGVVGLLAHPPKTNKRLLWRKRRRIGSIVTAAAHQHSQHLLVFAPKGLSISSYPQIKCGRREDDASRLRKCYIWKNSVSYTVVYQNATAFDSSIKVRPMSGIPNRRSFLRCCLGTMLNAPEIAPLSWVSFVDQMLLITTIAFAYMAGVIPNNSFYPTITKNTIEETASNLGASFPGRYATTKTSTNSNNSWVQVERKLLDALDAISDNSDLIRCDSSKTNCPSSLLALKGASRLRLLIATLSRLYKEVLNISQALEGSNRDTRLVTFSKTIQESIQPIFLNWLEGELSLQKKGREKGLIYGALGKLDAGDPILQKIKLLEKADLYGDLIFYLRFRSLGSYYYDECILMQHEIEILEDLVITLADGICSVYLELISLDSSLSPVGSYLGSSLCSLSTRALQKLRNQAALDQWLIQNFQSVVSMYEDRFDLFVLKKEPLEKPDMDVTSTFNSLKCSLFQKQSSQSYLNHIAITQSPIFIRRTKELKALVGWRYCYSLFLELSDISMPLIRAAFVNARNAISFFLTCLIGRSLGLIYAGIRQSLGWR